MSVYSHRIGNFGLNGEDRELILVKDGEDVDGGVFRKSTYSDPFKAADDYGHRWVKLN